ncbi:GPR endopeptidase [Paenibacillus thermoaerophilus]|uniref:Germination protease n=1 Tax=Paenibacillus thermoaerophilus TaxID=1215385 RepID=A0ABW2UXD4_9BACL|nr:GPR endopeptidase [Paenibacillus thermoaerophilus]TMV18985.1 GPR endopeptidase [Paenibacillus thermoaerophilus]
MSLERGEWNNEQDLSAYSVRTDLALEAQEMASAGRTSRLPGVESETETHEGMKITRIRVLNEEGVRTLGKQIGNYITIEVPGLRHKDSVLQDKVATRFANEFASFLERAGIGKEAKALIIGLGNWHVTPDSLGPLVVENVMVTRHYFELMPDQVHPGYRSVSAIAPGVLGTTGIETSEIVQGIVERSKPDVVIAIDALASMALERVNTTIQIADTGIHPGSGVGNKRKGLTMEHLGVPVIAIGVPTVVYASTIVNSIIEMLVQNFKKQTSNTQAILGMLDGMPEQERLGMVKEVLDPIGQDLLVTPKDIDQFVEDIANIIASGLNAALHEAVDSGNVAAYTH